METLRHLLGKRSPKKDEELSARTGISPERIGQLLSSAEPTLGELGAIANYFRIDMRDLLPLQPRHQSIDLLFRSGGRKVDEPTASALSRRIGYSVELLGEGARARPSWVAEFSRRGTTYDDAEANAEAFRRLFADDDQVSPLFRLPEIAMGAMKVLLFLLATPRFEGASAFVDGLPFIFLAERFAPRMLFTLAHEIAHLLAHHDLSQSFAVVDVQTEGPRRASKNRDEFYAHAFASCLLLPRQGIGITLRKIRELQLEPNKELGDLDILLLSRVYGVSFYAAAKRCEDLSLLPRGGAASLNDSLNKKYGSPEKRAAAANLPPRPETQFPKLPIPLLHAAIEKVRSGEISVGKASSALGLSIADLLAANAPRVN